MLWRRDSDAEPGPVGGQRAALHPILQHGPLLADALGAADRLLSPANRDGPAQGAAAAVDSRLAALPQAARLPLLSCGQMAPDGSAQTGGGWRFRPFVSVRGLGPLLLAGQA